MQRPALLTVAALALLLAAYAPARAQDASARTFQSAQRDLMSLSKQRAQSLIERQAKIVELFKTVTEPAKIENAYDEAVKAIGEAIALYDDKSDLWRLWKEQDKRIGELLNNANERALKDVRWADRVRSWEERQRENETLRLELERQLTSARTSLKRVKEDRDLVIDIMYAQNVEEAQKLMRQSIAEFAEINGNMDKLIKQMDGAMGRGVQQ